MNTPAGQAIAPAAYNGQPALHRPIPKGFSFLWMGWAGAGKSSGSDSGPQPRLIADIEGEANWTPSLKTEWNPQHQPPQPPGLRLTAGYGQPSRTPEWESALAICRKPQDIFRIYEVLNSGRHPFNSVSVDSVTEMQSRIMDTLRPDWRQLERDQWGALLRQTNGIIRSWRDLRDHPVRPLWTVSFVAGMVLDQTTRRYRPLLQGAGRDYLPYYVSVCGYLDAQPDGTRLLYTRDLPGYEVKERLGGRLPAVMPIAYPGRAPGWTLEAMAAHVLATQ